MSNKEIEKQKEGSTNNPTISLVVSITIEEREKGSTNNLDKSFRSFLNGLGHLLRVLWIFTFIVTVGSVIVLTIVEDPPEQLKETEAEKQEVLEKDAWNKEQGFHCLSAWEGAHQQFKEQVRRGVKDPKSFEHIETRIGKVDKNSYHLIEMVYRAKNSFGGYAVAKATGLARQSDCSSVATSLE